MDEIFFQVMLRTFHALSTPVLTHKWAAFQWSPAHVEIMETDPQVLQLKKEKEEADQKVASEQAKKTAQALQHDKAQIGGFEL
jgi:Asp/Glu/hydantoin racemase